MHEHDARKRSRAAERRRDAYRDHRVAVVHLIGARAAGKTTLLEATVRALTAEARIGVVSTDVTMFDVRRLVAAGAEAAVIATGASGAVESAQIDDALEPLPWRDLDYLFVEEAAIPVVSSGRDQDLHVVVLAATEDFDQPLRLRAIYERADLVLLTQVDLLPRPVDLQQIRANVAAAMPHPALLAVSTVTGDGIDQWVRWLRGIGRPRLAPCALGVVRM